MDTQFLLQEARAIWPEITERTKIITATRARIDIPVLRPWGEARLAQVDVPHWGRGWQLLRRLASWLNWTWLYDRTFTRFEYWDDFAKESITANWWLNLPDGTGCYMGYSPKVDMLVLREAARPERPNTVEVTNGHSGGVAGSLET